MQLRSSLRKRVAAWARRRQGADVCPFELTSRRVYILPTPVGISFTAMLLVMLIAGINYGNSTALFLTFLLAGFGLVAMHQCHRNLVRTSVISAATLPTFAKVAGTVRIALQNDATFTRYSIEAQASDQRIAFSDIPPRSQAQINVSVEPAARGILRIDRLKISSTFPFGLFRAWSWAHLDLELIVYPRAHGSLPLPADTGFKSGSRSHALAGSDEWLGHRPFRDGDSPRQVDWKAYARGSPLLVKEYSALGAELRLFDFNKLEQLGVESRLEQISRWVVDAETRGERYGLIVPPHRFEPDTGPEHRHRCLTALASYGLDRASNDG